MKCYACGTYENVKRYKGFLDERSRNKIRRADRVNLCRNCYEMGSGSLIPRGTKSFKQLVYIFDFDKILKSIRRKNDRAMQVL